MRDAGRGGQDERADADGVRTVATPRQARSRRAWAGAAVVALAAGAALWLALAPAPAARSRDAPGAGDDDARAAPPSVPRTVPGTPPPATGPRADPSDPADLANYIRPGDPEPTGAEVIDALHAAGVRTGIGAFNPPGTSPVLAGLAVPEGFALPPGYVRHHQVTDQGVPLEPILMFSPDFQLYDAQGRPLPMPANRVVPPEYAPPGLPLRRVHAGAR